MTSKDLVRDVYTLRKYIFNIKYTRKMINPTTTVVKQQL